ncbi:MAG TPA: hypothetical protein DEP04_07780 [Dehalococcoidia bacterium]|nr:hypothetical protein [Dehalococcoidia bacterium]
MNVITSIRERRKEAERKVPFQSKSLIESRFVEPFFGSGSKTNAAIHNARILNAAIKTKMALHPI